MKVLISTKNQEKIEVAINYFDNIEIQGIPVESNDKVSRIDLT